MFPYSFGTGEKISLSFSLLSRFTTVIPLCAVYQLSVFTMLMLGDQKKKNRTVEKLLSFNSTVLLEEISSGQTVIQHLSSFCASL